MKKLTKCLMLAALLAGASLSAAELKVAVINMDHVFNNYYRTKIVDSNLKQQRSVYESYLKQLGESVEKLNAQFKELRDASQNIAATETQRESKRLEAQKKHRELQEKKLEMEQYAQDKGKQFSELEQKQREDIIKEITQEVKRRATLDGYSLVIDSSGKTTNNISPVVFFQSNLDISETVLRDLNRGASGSK